MGRIKTQQIKRTVKMLIKDPETFTTDFEKNKKILGEKASIYSKKLRNVIAGSITKNTKRKQNP